MACKMETIIQNCWLNYYNQYLFEHGAISEEERNKMRILIASQMHSKNECR